MTLVLDKEAHEAPGSKMVAVVVSPGEVVLFPHDCRRDEAPANFAKRLLDANTTPRAGQVWYAGRWWGNMPSLLLTDDGFASAVRTTEISGDTYVEIEEGCLVCTRFLGTAAR